MTGFTCFNCCKTIDGPFVGRMGCFIHLKKHNECVAGKNYEGNCYECCGLSIDPASQKYHRRYGPGCIKSDHVRDEAERNYIREIPFVMIQQTKYPFYMQRMLELETWEDLDYVIHYQNTFDSPIETQGLRELYMKTFKPEEEDFSIDEKFMFDPDAQLSKTIEFVKCYLVLRRDIVKCNIKNFYNKI